MPENKPKTLIIDDAKCISCGICVSLCPQNALTLTDGVPVLTGKCRVCGLCASSCITKAITMAAEKFRDESLVKDIDRDVAVFSCRRNAPKEGVDASVVSLLCSARVDLSLIADAFAKGAAAVIISTCGKSCRNYPGSKEAASKVMAFRRILARIGEDEDRVVLVEGDFTEVLKSVRKFGKIENPELLRIVSLNRDLRAIVAKMRAITEEGNVYGEKIPLEKYMQLLDRTIDRAIKEALILQNLSDSLKLSELVEKTSLSHQEILDALLEMKRKDLIELEVDEEVVVSAKG